MQPYSFEIYAFKDGAWSLDSIHDDQDLSLSLARALLSTGSHSAVRIVRKGGEGANAKPALIFKDSKGDISVSDKAWTDAIKKKKEDRLKSDAQKAEEKAKAKRDALVKAKKAKADKVFKVTFKMIVISGAAVGAVIGLVYYLLVYFSKL